MSLSARRAWIEIVAGTRYDRPPLSLSARRAWIEMFSSSVSTLAVLSLSARRAWIEISASHFKPYSVRESLSARRAWIEILTDDVSTGGKIVALRKESVDRNFLSGQNRKLILSRSPQGERG